MKNYLSSNNKKTAEMRNAITKKMLMDIKLSKTHLSKMINSGTLC